MRFECLLVTTPRIIPTNTEGIAVVYKGRIRTHWYGTQMPFGGQVVKLWSIPTHGIQEKISDTDSNLDRSPGNDAGWEKSISKGYNCMIYKMYLK